MQRATDVSGTSYDMLRDRQLHGLAPLFTVGEFCVCRITGLVPGISDIPMLGVFPYFSNCSSWGWPNRNRGRGDVDRQTDR